MTFHPRLMIAGTASSVGKTTVTLGLIAALTRRGHAVQPFKVGPDYIDPSYHTLASGRPSRNLDTWMLSKSTVKHLFHRAAEGARFSVVEGVMGLFDGSSGNSAEGSSAELSKLLQIPVILVVDISHASRSVAAMAKGFVEFDRGVDVRGIILNKAGSERHARLVRSAVEQSIGVPVLGVLPRSESIHVDERHLGLLPTAENAGAQILIRTLADFMEEHVKVDRVENMARFAPSLRIAPRDEPEPMGFARIGIARDAAFHFYYEDNLQYLHALGAELVPFSPMRDASLPDIDALYFGGGFPEMFSTTLSGNKPMLEAVRSAAKAGLPVYAECGGLMYLVERLVATDGSTHEMAGLIPGVVEMTARLQNFGYSIARTIRDSFLSPKDKANYGHEFHYSRWLHEGTPETHLYEVEKPRTGGKRYEGYVQGRLAASYVHLHFWSSHWVAKSFVRAAVQFGSERKAA